MKTVIQTANYGPWASQIPENLSFSPKLVPSDSLAVLPPASLQASSESRW